MVGNPRIEMFKFKEAIIVRLRTLEIGERRTFKCDRSAWNDPIIHIGHRTDDRSSLRFGCGDVLGRRCTSDRHAKCKDTQAMLDTHLLSSPLTSCWWASFTLPLRQTAVSLVFALTDIAGDSPNAASSYAKDKNGQSLV